MTSRLTFSYSVPMHVMRKYNAKPQRIWIFFRNKIPRYTRQSFAWLNCQFHGYCLNVFFSRFSLQRKVLKFLTNFWLKVCMQTIVEDICTFRSFLFDCPENSLICRKNYAQFFAIFHSLVHWIVFYHCVLKVM